MSQTSLSYQFAAGQRSVQVSVSASSFVIGTLMRTYWFRSNDSRWYTSVKSLAGGPLGLARILSSMAVRS